MKRPLISAIVAVYNIESYIKKCINSIQTQTLIDFECILVDDGSIDESGRNCDFYSEQDRRFRTIHKINGGLSSARNAGLKEITGQYVIFIDGDDYIDKNLFEKLNNIVNKTSCDTVFYGYSNISQNGDAISIVLPKLPNDIYIGSEINELIERFVGFSYNSIYDRLCKDIPLRTNTEFPSVWRFLYNVEVLRKNKLEFDEKVKLGEDVIFNPQYLAACNKLVVLRWSGYNYVCRGNSLLQTFLNDNGPKMLNSKIGLMHARDEISNLIKKKNNYDIYTFWQGSIILSAVQIGLGLAKKIDGLSFYKRYMLYKTYVMDSVCVKAYRNFKLESLPFKFKVVFFPIKKGMYLLSFLLFTFCNLMKIEAEI